MVRCLIFDEKGYSAGILASHIQKIVSLHLIGIVSNFRQAIESVSKHEIEILFVCNKIANDDLPHLSNICVHLIMIDEIELAVPVTLGRQRSVVWLDKPLSFSSLTNAYHGILE